MSVHVWVFESVWEREREREKGGKVKRSEKPISSKIFVDVFNKKVGFYKLVRKIRMNANEEHRYSLLISNFSQNFVTGDEQYKTC